MISGKYIDEFLDKSKQGRATEYRFKLRVFDEFLVETYDTTASNYFKIIGGLTKQDLLNGVEFYVNRKGVKKINYCSPVRVYFSAVLEFLKFLNNKHPVSNELFDSQQMHTDLRASLESKLKELRLKESESDIHISPEECKLLVEKCDLYIDPVSDEKLINSDIYNSDYSRFLSSILLKLVLFTGSSLETVNKMTTKDYDDELNILRVNGYSVHIPDKLAKQLKKYIRVRENICVGYDEKALFLKRKARTMDDGKNTNRLHSTDICYVLKEVVGRNSVRSVSKYAVISMIKQGIPQYLIMDFTGYKDEVYSYCLDIANEDSYESGSRILDSKLRSLEIFDKL